MKMAWCLLVFCLIGCGDMLGTDCKVRTEIVDVVSGSIFASYLSGKVTTLESEGWECVSEGLYNAFGGRFGTRYTCTICD